MSDPKVEAIALHDSSIPVSDEDNTTTSLLSKGTKGYPLHAYCILLQEVCERFSYYGLRAILAVYFTDFLLYSEDLATECVHIFIFASYFSSIFGGWLSDTHLGRYSTILWLTMVYIAGSIILSLTAIPGATGSDPPHWWGFSIALLLVAIGTGGIKPCVSAFMGDQFGAGLESELKMMFSWFYFSINIGATLSMLTTPLIEDKFDFSLAFGTSAILLTSSLIVFVLGSKRYTKLPPTGNVYRNVYNVIRTAWKESRKAGPNENPMYPNWLDYATEEHGSTAVEDIKALRDVGLVFATVPIFWSLYDQSSSRWVFQAGRMDLFNGAITKSQVQAIQPFLVLFLVPVFNKFVYPGLAKLGIILRPIPRIAVGYIFTSSAFVAAALLELYIGSQPENSVSVAWQFPQNFLLICGEILVSITGLEFAYSQAPQSMKGIVMAMWLMTVAIGNIIVVIIAGAPIGDQSIEFWIYASLMFTSLFVMFYITRKIQYRGYEATVTPLGSPVSASDDGYGAKDDLTKDEGQGQ